MAVSELIKHHCAWPSMLAPRYQFDCLRGPAFGLHFPEARDKRCLCVERSANINRWRASRVAAVAQ
jgi:hypothetical protein